MIEKIKNVCKNKTVRIIAVILFILSVIVLLLGGITEQELNEAIKAILVAIAAIGVVITIAGSLISKIEKKNISDK